MDLAHPGNRTAQEMRNVLGSYEAKASELQDVETLHDEENVELAAAAVAASETKDLASRTRVDSARDGVPQLPPEQRTPRIPLTITIAPHTDSMPPPAIADTIAASPTLSKHTIPIAEGSSNTLPAVLSRSSTQDTAAGSPQKEFLPSFRQLTGSLPELAEAAATQEARASPYGHHHSRSFGSATSQSPRLNYNPYAGSAQTSPAARYAFGAKSPTSTITETQHYGSPPQYPTSAYYANRRSSAAPEITLPFPASLPSASSSGESYGLASSGTEGYSTAHTTPIDLPQSAGGAQRSIMPPPISVPPSVVNLNAGFKCEYPECNAPPFQTQYLLSSHRNVHSQSRPHYCPVKDCPRSEGGKGFKRKNEMIRHGLVHSSPGYICPFCPDREHRYPRPDNLQRHVRVHHVDKDRDDPLLRDVLAQRMEGSVKSRRRRTNGCAPAPLPD